MASNNFIRTYQYMEAKGDQFGVQLAPDITLNYTEGAPGSFFTLLGYNFLPGEWVTVSINGVFLGAALTDSLGNLVVLLESHPETDEGVYFITTSGNSTDSPRFTLDEQFEIHPPDGAGVVFQVPDGIAYHLVYVPIVGK
jgi:hypothetical protein